MNNKESENPNSKGLSKQAMNELRLRGAKVREVATKTQKSLERILPYANEKTLHIRLK